MNTWDTILDDVQEYLALKIVALPFVYALYLQVLEAREKQGTVCMLPAARLELYKIRIEARICERAHKLKQRMSINA